jgi:hypothetical protein
MYYPKIRDWCEFCNSLSPKFGTLFKDTVFACEDCLKEIAGVQDYDAHYDQGYDDGLQEGRDIGYDKGYADGEYDATRYPEEHQGVQGLSRTSEPTAQAAPSTTSRPSLRHTLARVLFSAANRLAR